MEQSSSYANRMEQSPKAAATLVTPRSGYEFDDAQGSIRRGVSVRSDHPCVAQHRGAFMLATGGCHPHPSVAATTPKQSRRAAVDREDEDEG